MIGGHPVHPVADIFPMMAEAEFQTLAADIKAHGLREPIWTDSDGCILDGRNRLRACRLADVPTAFRIYNGDDPLGFVISLNLHRRHLNESQRAMVAARLAEWKNGLNQYSSGRANLPAHRAGALLGISERTVKTARAVRNNGTPTLSEAVDVGLITVSDAAGIVGLPTEEQEILVSDVKAGKHKTLRRAAAARRHEIRQTPPPNLPPPDARCRLLMDGVADLAERLDAASIDHIITDPPYPRDFLPVYADLARTAARVLKPGGSCLVMVGQSYLPDILAAMTPHLRYHWTVAYLTPGGQATQLWDRRVNTFWKPVLWFVNGDHAGEWVGDVTRSAPNDNDKRFHHWGQSETGMADLVRRFTAAGDTILDPFLGGGTTGVVALDLGRQFVGADIDPAAVDIAGRRFAAAREAAHAG